MAVIAAGCSSADGSQPPEAGASDGDLPAPTDAGDAAAGEIGAEWELGETDGTSLEAAPYPVEDALAAEGGDALAEMIDELDVPVGEVTLTVAVGPEGDPAISDWRLPGASASAILDAWRAVAPGAWSSDELSGLPAASGTGIDGVGGWAFATDGRFVYVRTDERSVAEEVAGSLRD